MFRSSWPSSLRFSAPQFSSFSSDRWAFPRKPNLEARFANFWAIFSEKHLRNENGANINLDLNFFALSNFDRFWFISRQKKKRWLFQQQLNLFYFFAPTKQSAETAVYSRLDRTIHLFRTNSFLTPYFRATSRSATRVFRMKQIAGKLGNWWNWRIWKTESPETCHDNSLCFLFTFASLRKKHLRRYDSPSRLLYFTSQMIFSKRCAPASFSLPSVA